jgi:hypothetical protein
MTSNLKLPVRIGSNSQFLAPPPPRPDLSPDLAQLVFAEATPLQSKHCNQIEGDGGGEGIFQLKAVIT